MRITGGALICLLALGAAPVAAQSAGMGVRAGVNVNSLSTDGTEFGTESNTGLVAGVFGTAPFGGAFSMQTEVLFSIKGAKVTGDGEEGTLRLTYMEVPILANIRVSSGPVPVSLLLGPSFGFRLKAELETAVETLDLKAETRKADIGLVTGVALDLGRHLLVDGRATWGLQNVNLGGDPGSVKNRTISLTLGWRF